MRRSSFFPPPPKVVVCAVVTRAASFDHVNAALKAFTSEITSPPVNSEKHSAPNDAAITAMVSASPDYPFRAVGSSIAIHS